MGRMSLVGMVLALVAGSAGAEEIARAVAGHYELTPTLRRGLTAQDDAVRARCAFLLGQVGERSAAEALRPLLADPSLAVRRQAGIALCALGRAEGLPATEAALASAAEWIRYYAVQALAGIATDPAQAALQARREGQGELIAGQIDVAIEAWPWPSAPPAPAAEKMEISGSLHELFVEVGGAWVVESDEYWHGGDYLQCVRCNETTLFLDPHHVELYGTSAWLLWSLGLNDRATSLLRRGVKANPTDWEAWFDAGYQHSLMNEHGTAARFLRRAVDLGAPAVQSRQYCHALEKSGRPAAALEAWQALQRRFPDDPLAAGHIARLRRVLAGEDTSSTEV